MLQAAGPSLYREGQPIYTLPDGPGGNRADATSISALTLDHEGSLWLGTVAAGLHRLKPALFTVVSSPYGLANPNVLSVHEDRTGAIWIGAADGGPHRLSGGRLTRFPPDAGYPRTVRSFLEDARGRLWMGGGAYNDVVVCDLPDVRCTVPEGSPLATPSVLAMHEEPGGALWFGTDGGLFRLDGGEWRRVTGVDGAPGAPVRAFLRTRDGALWMGTMGDGLVRYDGRGFVRVTVDDGLPFDMVRSLYQDADGWLWVGTEGRGLARLDPRDWVDCGRGGRIVAVRARDGLYDEVVHQILEDDQGRLWMSSNRGIFWIDRAQLIAFAEGRTPRVNSTAYTESEGLRNREPNGGSQPAGIRAQDGRLWFATQDGAAVVDPARIRRNLAAPNVVIEQVRAGGTAVPARATLELGVEQRDLEIEYTALSLLAPGNVRFRYRLEPYDRDWVEAGGRRTAYYTQVPPGRYTFRVSASNNDGVWNETGASLDLQLAARFRETAAFRALVLFVAALLLAGGVGWRAYQLRLRSQELRRLVAERTYELEREKEVTTRQARALAELDRAKSRFFANASHEFRTPLTLILGPLRDLGEGRHGALPAAVRRQLEMMTRNAQRLMRLVNQVLDLAHLESGTLTLTTEPRDLVELARALVPSFCPLAERRDVRLGLHTAVERLPVEIDAEQMEKVLLNLISNALKFTEPGGSVDVLLRSEDGHAVVEVVDTGIGIAPEQQAHVFDRFYQADSTATRRHEGTGIGLSLVRELVELHGGAVEVVSVPGEGSTFRVRLPLCEAAEGASGPRVDDLATAVMAAVTSAEPAPAPENGDEDPDRTAVLVVDDNADVRSYVRSVLEPTYRVLEAADGQEGLERAREALPDLVVADVMMPRLDGFALARALREDPATDCIPIVLLTARAGEDTEIEGLATGADDYLAKPFHAGVLEARVGALIASRRLLRERFREEGLPAPTRAAEPTPVRSELEERLRAIVEANLLEPDFNPDALAAAAGFSYQTLYRRLREELSATPSQLIRTVRVERAADLLRDGAGSVTEVAYSVGFNSLSHFHRSYRERFGASPTATLRTSSA
jgi:signal transduction histidine kinase/AraC-like DNA-binding protein